MTFVAYTNCETGFRHFTHLHGVDLSYDKKFIEYIISNRREQTTQIEKLTQRTEVAMEHMQEDSGIDVRHISEHNRRVTNEVKSWQKRLSTAEVVLNGELVRDVLVFTDIGDAIHYTRGTP